jgi:hypothetical protein
LQARRARRDHQLLGIAQQRFSRSDVYVATIGPSASPVATYTSLLQTNEPRAQLALQFVLLPGDARRVRLISRPDTATLPVVAALRAATAGHEGLAATHDLVFRLALSLH